MNYKCPTCNNTVEYVAGTSKMNCKYCGNYFYFRDVVRNQSPVIEKKDTCQTMECNIYVCTDCGAELVINDVEASTFCAYCGQPTIVFSRVSQELMPKYILPFCVTKDAAVEIVRRRLRKGFFVSKKVKNFNAEIVRGIYIPYYTYDVLYHDKQKLFCKKGLGKYAIFRTYRREAECEFRGVTCDASKKLNDEVSQRLEPYDLRGLRLFTPKYLSGYYADCFDMDKEEITKVAISRIKKWFDEEIERSTHSTQAILEESNPQYKIKKEEYVFLPVWFLTFHHKKETYTILVNGQTGKMVGSAPFHKGKVITLFVFIFLIAASVFTAYEMLILHLDLYFKIPPILILVPIAFACVGGGVGYAEFRKSMRLTKEKQTAEFASERQGES